MRMTGISIHTQTVSMIQVRSDADLPTVRVCHTSKCCCDPGGMIPLEAGRLFKQAIVQADPSRPASANMVRFGNDTLSAVLDVQGFSHGGSRQGPAYREAGFTKPVINSECCSCRTLRGSYSINATDLAKGGPSSSKYLTDWNSVNAACSKSNS